ncbi:MAG: hypothetical protein ACKODS_08740, partial [Methylophilaceae bacterium]
CCIIEQNLEENGDFEGFYRKTVRTFYRKGLSEIEEETKNLLQFKHYYAMKKTMMLSGVISVSMLSIGLILKFLHMPGASALMVVGIALFSFLFLPLMMVLKLKEKTERTDKILVVLAVFSAITMTLGTLFKVMYWPGANMLSIVALLNLLFVFLPFYFYNGLRKPETKTNTAISGMLMLAGCGLILTLLRAPHSSHALALNETKNYVQDEQLLNREYQLIMQSSPTTTAWKDPAAGNIYKLCSDMKGKVVQLETGMNSIGADFEAQGLTITDSRIDRFIYETPEVTQSWDELKNAIGDYNRRNRSGAVATTLFDAREIRTIEALHGLIRIQRALLANEMGGIVKQ